MKMKLGNEGAGSAATWLGWEDVGHYLALILAVDESPTKRDQNNTPIDAIKVSLAIISPDEKKGRQYDLWLYHPDMSGSDAGINFAIRKQTAFLVAAGLVTESQFGQEVEVNLQLAVGRFVFIDLEHEKDKEKKVKLDSNGNPRLGLAFANIFHVDDPAVSDAALWPRNPAMIAKIPAAGRRDPASFPKHERKSGTAGGASAGAGGAAQGQQTPPKNVDFEGF